MNDVGAAIAAEFGDLSAVRAAQLAVRLLVAAGVGGLLGWQRLHAGKAAGLRTHILVAVGAAAIVAVPEQAGMSFDGISRIIQGVITGIGFLGTGSILKAHSEDHVRGLTTAAGIWLTAGVGVVAGLGREASALVLGIIAWFTLSTLARWERKPTSGK